MKKSLFLFLQEAGIALFSQAGNEEEEKRDIKPTTLGCAGPGNSLQELLASATALKSDQTQFVKHFVTVLTQYNGSIGFF